MSHTCKNVAKTRYFIQRYEGQKSKAMRVSDSFVLRPIKSYL